MDFSNYVRQLLRNGRLQEAPRLLVSVVADLDIDCSTKSWAREIRVHFSDGRPGQQPLRSEDFPEGILYQQLMLRVFSATMWRRTTSWTRSMSWSSEVALRCEKTLGGACIGHCPRRCSPWIQVGTTRPSIRPAPSKQPDASIRSCGICVGDPPVAQGYVRYLDGRPGC